MKPSCTMPCTGNFAASQSDVVMSISELFCRALPWSVEGFPRGGPIVGFRV